VRFLVDANLSPRVAELLNAAGHDAVAVRDAGLKDAPDGEILDHAGADDRVVVSHDTDFGTLLAMRQLTKPSFILIRSQTR
jgi:predicted nuclease of predicted toxin-antitoxin system